MFFDVAAFCLWITLWITWKTPHISPLLLLSTPQLPTQGKIIVPFYPAKSKGMGAKTAPQMDFSQFVQRGARQAQRFASNVQARRIFAGKRKIAAPYCTMRRYFYKNIYFLREMCRE
ncbi:hypothetical protein [Gemmiger sp.]